MLTGQECERSRRQQALHCGHSGKSGQRGRRVATGLRGYGACEAAEGVVQKSGAKDESSRSGTLTFNGTHASERGAAARKVEWGPALREFENFVGSRFTPACNTSRNPRRAPRRAVPSIIIRAMQFHDAQFNTQMGPRRLGPSPHAYIQPETAIHHSRPVAVPQCRCRFAWHRRAHVECADRQNMAHAHGRTHAHRARTIHVSRGQSTGCGT